MAQNIDSKLHKTSYKWLIILIKYIPFIIASCYIVNTIAALFGCVIEPLSNIAGMSLITWVFIYVAAIVFKFCIYHKMFLWYIFADDSINIADYYIELPFGTDTILMFHNSLIGLLLFIILFIYVKTHKKFFSKNT